MFSDERKNLKTRARTHARAHTHTHTHTYSDICIHIQKIEKELPVNLKPQNSPMIHTCTQKKLLRKPKTTPTPTHTHTHNYNHMKYQRQVKQTKVNTVQERGTTPPYINQFDQPNVLYTGNKGEFKFIKYPIKKGLVQHMISDESNKLKTYVCMYMMGI